MRPAVLVLALATACNQLLGTPEVHRGACDARAAFVHPAPVGGFDSGLGVQSAQLSRDELTVVFSRVTIAGLGDAPVSRHGDLYIAHRDHRDDDFHDAAPLESFNTDADEHSASLSDDRETLYFDRQDPSQSYQIFAARRSSPADPFGAAAPLTLNDGGSSDVEPYVTSSAMFFATRRADGTASLFTAAGHGTSFAAAQPLDTLEMLPFPTAYDNPVVSDDALTIYFAAPPDSAAPPDIWSAARRELDQPFGSPHPIAELNSSSADRPAWISEDSCRLYFMTNRVGRGFELWMATRAPP